VQAFAGLMHVTGEPDGPPLLAGMPVADVSAGVHAFAAIGHALFARSRTGLGCHIDVAMVDALFHQHEIPVFAASIDPDYQAVRSGQHFPTQCPAGAFRGPDGWIVIFCTQEQVGRLWEAMGRPEYSFDDRFSDPRARVAHRDLLTNEIEAWLQTFSDDAAALAALDRHRVPCSPVVDPGRAHAIDYYRERGVVETVEDPRMGPVNVPGFPFRVSDTPVGVDTEAPSLGADNSHVLAEVLGLDPQQIEALVTAGVVAQRG